MKNKAVGKKKKLPLASADSRTLVRGREFDPKRFHNRDLSWLEFNARVLHEASDVRTPLLERLRFCDIWRSNLDEFMMKRVGLLESRIEVRDFRLSLDGRPPLELLQEIRGVVSRQIKSFS